MQLRESQDRENNIKRMHETLMAALQHDPLASSGMKVTSFL